MHVGYGCCVWLLLTNGEFVHRIAFALCTREYHLCVCADECPALSVRHSIQILIVFIEMTLKSFRSLNGPNSIVFTLVDCILRFLIAIFIIIISDLRTVRTDDR